VTLSRRDVKDLLESHGLRPSRALGQNFVSDPNTVRRIARLAEVGPGDRVIEIGPGLGSLTLALAGTGAAVTALELDRHLIPVLESVLSGTTVKVVQGDAMTADWVSLLGADPGWVLVANLPYNVATPIVANLLDDVGIITRMLVMVQREVGERLVAGPGDEGYGAVSVKIAYWAEASIAGRVSAEVFYPRPKVESVLVSIRRRPVPALDPGLVSPQELFAVVRAGFATRRKMLRRALAGLADEAVFERARVSPQSRAENLDLDAWGRLSHEISGSGAGLGSHAGGGAQKDRVR
jgi:16S rRNA (adenine1518-N6/adenine1519-N6)-dimethyltransferase